MIKFCPKESANVASNVSRQKGRTAFFSSFFNLLLETWIGWGVILEPADEGNHPRTTEKLLEEPGPLDFMEHTCRPGPSTYRLLCEQNKLPCCK